VQNISDFSWKMSGRKLLHVGLISPVPFRA
jgi:hypothetical protein